jgi:hypothetical protein
MPAHALPAARQPARAPAMRRAARPQPPRAAAAVAPPAPHAPPSTWADAESILATANADALLVGYHLRQGAVPASAPRPTVDPAGDAPPASDKPILLFR